MTLWTAGDNAVRYMAAILRSKESVAVAVRAAMGHDRFGSEFQAEQPGSIASMIEKARSLAASGEKTPRPIRERAIEFAASVVAKVTDWQDVEQALWTSDTYGPWIRAHPESEHLSMMQEIVREGEEAAREAGRMSSGYS